jgi:hypothetical protein
MAFLRPALRTGRARISNALSCQLPHSVFLSTAVRPPGKYESPNDFASSEILAHFHVEKEQYVSELDVLARVYRHKSTGAQLLSLRGDAHKTFAIAFRTPANSNGVAHIMEHSVLCGSSKYPSKEPFVDLLKSSLYTFLNAMTYPDRCGLANTSAPACPWYRAAFFAGQFTPCPVKTRKTCTIWWMCTWMQC